MYTLGLRKLSYCLITTLLLTGCGGADTPATIVDGAIEAETPTTTPNDTTDDDNTSADANTISGKVLDGYLVNALVCHDANNNRQCDATEVQTRSVANGAYTLDLPDDVAKEDAQIIAIADDQTIDEDSDALVEKRFILTGTPGQYQVLSPFTTLAMRRMSQTQKSLDDVIVDITKQIGVADPFADYIAEDDASSHHLARSMVALLGNKLEEKQQVIPEDVFDEGMVTDSLLDAIWNNADQLQQFIRQNDSPTARDTALNFLLGKDENPTDSQSLNQLFQEIDSIDRNTLERMQNQEAQEAMPSLQLSASQAQDLWAKGIYAYISDPFRLEAVTVFAEEGDSGSDFKWQLYALGAADELFSLDNATGYRLLGSRNGEWVTLNNEDFTVALDADARRLQVNLDDTPYWQIDWTLADLNNQKLSSHAPDSYWHLLDQSNAANFPENAFKVDLTISNQLDMYYYFIPTSAQETQCNNNNGATRTHPCNVVVGRAENNRATASLPSSLGVLKSLIISPPYSDAYYKLIGNTDNDRFLSIATPNGNGYQLSTSTIRWDSTLINNITTVWRTELPVAGKNQHRWALVEDGTTVYWLEYAPAHSQYTFTGLNRTAALEIAYALEQQKNDGNTDVLNNPYPFSNITTATFYALDWRTDVNPNCWRKSWHDLGEAQVYRSGSGFEVGENREAQGIWQVDQSGILQLKGGLFADTNYLKRVPDKQHFCKKRTDVEDDAAALETTLAEAKNCTAADNTHSMFVTSPQIIELNKLATPLCDTN